MTRKVEFNKRELRGLAIVAKGGMIKRLNEDTYLVRSSDLECWYKVAWKGRGWCCECKDFLKTNQPCKHVYAVAFWNRLPFILMANFQADTIECPRCGSNKVTRKGLIYGKGFTAQRYRCKMCKHKFGDKGDSKGLKGNPFLLVAAVDLYFKGLSLRMIEDHFRRVYSFDISYSAIRRWIRRFVKVLKALEEKLVSDIGGRWHADDMQVKIDGKIGYLWNVLSGETKILLASILTYGRGSEDAEMAIREALTVAKTQPSEIVTDGLKSYQVAIKNVFKGQVNHISRARFTDVKNNNVMERVNETVRTRVRGFRKLGNERSASQLFEGLRLYYNSMRPHLALGGRCPADIVKSRKNQVK